MNDTLGMAWARDLHSAQYADSMMFRGWRRSILPGTQQYLDWLAHYDTRMAQIKARERKNGRAPQFGRRNAA